MPRREDSSTASEQPTKLRINARLELFDQASARQRARPAEPLSKDQSQAGRNWQREDLYERRDAKP